MRRDSLVVATDIHASVEVAWWCLTAGRDAWWPEMRFEAVVGSPLTETWVEEGRQRSATGSVTRCEEPHLLGFRWAEEGWDHPLDVVIDLVARGESTSLTLTESGFIRARTSLSLLAEHEEGWRYHVARLKRASEDHAAEVGAHATRARTAGDRRRR
ncbi:SRPBCC domain-containing protein [Microbacterium sp. W1N]|uniref:SRPBCC family protein n=1 Tax=Microbacterium festucae TaxID=2977531 RepID=UPI0021C13945|nr:SRPBCC domain-containing protein [Microbacterium festucae]MCT9821420.1 SRPBCC domain-containing protein [Microbacterium festucae]